MCKYICTQMKLKFTMIHYPFWTFTIHLFMISPFCSLTLFARDVYAKVHIIRSQDDKHILLTGVLFHILSH